MPRRKPVPKRKPTSALQLNAATQAAIEAALAPTMASLAKVSEAISAQHAYALRDIAAAIRAAAEAPTEYALIPPSPDSALIARNAEHAAQKYPAEHTWGVQPYLSQTSLEDEPQSRENFTRLFSEVSAPARALLYLVAGRWAEHTYSPLCVLDKGEHGEGCRHGLREVPYTLNALARDLYGEKTGGKQVRRIAALLEELERAQVRYGTTQTEGEESHTAALNREPLLINGGKGVGVGAESREERNIVRHLVLSKGLHSEYRTGSYRRIRRALLTGLNGWEQELALRLFSHIGTYYGSRRLQNSTDKRSATIRVGRTVNEPEDLGALSLLLPSYAKSPAMMRKKLEEFAQEINNRRVEGELRIESVEPIRHRGVGQVKGWALRFTYPEPPLTGKQRKQFAQVGEARKVLETGTPTEIPIRTITNSDGTETVVLPPARLQEPARTPECSHGEPMRRQESGTSKSGKPYAAFWQARHRTPEGWCKEKRQG